MEEIRTVVSSNALPRRSTERNAWTLCTEHHDQGFQLFTTVGALEILRIVGIADSGIKAVAGLGFVAA